MTMRPVDVEGINNTITNLSSSFVTDHMVTIKTVGTKDLPQVERKTKIKFTNNMALFWYPMVTLYRLCDEETKCLLPSRIWFDKENEQFTFLYYLNKMLNTKAFADENNVYFFVIPHELGVSISYDMRVRIFIDQIAVDGKMFYLFVAGESDLDMLFEARKENNEPN